MTAIHTHSKILKSTHFHWRSVFYGYWYIFGPLWRFDRGADKKRMWWQKDEHSFFDSWNMGLKRFPIWDWVAGAMTKPKSKSFSYTTIGLTILWYLTRQSKKNVVSKDESKNYHGSFLILEIWGWDSRFEIGLQVLWQNVLCLPDSIVLLTFQAAIAPI